MFMGEYQHNLDEKQRIVMPSIFRNKLGNDFIITRGIDHCVYIYSNEDWKKIVAKLETLSFTKANARKFIRAFFSAASICNPDKSGRINISQPLISYADLEKECVIIGADDHLEIWNSKAWNNFLTDNETILSDISEDLFGE